jgi:hypothetical protein
VALATYATHHIFSAAEAANRIALDPNKGPSHDACMRTLTLFLLLGCTACSADPGAAPVPAPATPAPSAGLSPQIRALTTDASCTSSSQCHTLALGARACGGPQSYLAWSSAHTDGAALRLLAQRYAEQEKERIAASGELSDCRMIVDPGAECRAGHCQLRTTGTADPS